MISEKISHIGWYNEQTKQFENLYLEKYVNELKQEIKKKNKVINDEEKYYKDKIKELKKQYIKDEQKLFHDNEVLQQRIDKSIKYIEEYWRKSFLLGTWEFYGSGEELIKILRGKDE